MLTIDDSRVAWFDERDPWALSVPEGRLTGSELRAKHILGLFGVSESWERTVIFVVCLLRGRVSMS